MQYRKYDHFYVCKNKALPALLLPVGEFQFVLHLLSLTEPLL